MAIINDPDQLSQGLETAVADMRFSGQTGAQVTITSAGTSLPTITAGDYFEIRGAINPENNGLYLEDGGSPTTGSVTASKVGGSAADPQNSAVDNTGASALHDDGTVTEEKSVFFDTIKREIWLIPGQGSLTGGVNATDTGVILQFLYSFAKEEWKNDNTLIVHPFPFTAITPEQFELSSGWTFHRGAVGKGTTYEATQLIRTGGFREVAVNGTLNDEFASIVSLGTFEDATNDKAYFQQGDDITDTTAPTDFSFFGPVNEVVTTYSYKTSLGDIAIAGNGSANTITSSGAGVVNFKTLGFKEGGQITVVTSDTAGDLTAAVGGTYTIDTITTVSTTNDTITLTNGLLANDATNTTFTAAVNNRNILNIFLREPENGGDTNGKTFGFSDLAAIGADASGLDNKVFRFPLTNATDLKISEEDATIAVTSPWTEVKIRYFNTNAFTREVDVEGGSPRSFGVVIDVGTVSGVDGVTNGTTTFTSADSPWATDATFVGGTLTIHEGNAKASYGIVSVTDANTIVLDATATADTGASFTLQRATPVVATTQEIFESVQYQLRQNSDINATSVAADAVTGSLATELLFFTGDNLRSGSESGASENPVTSSAGNGVIIEGFKPEDLNILTFVDNGGEARAFPFVTSIILSFNDNLFSSGGVNDGKVWLFFQYTKQFNVTNTVTIGNPSAGAAQFTTTSGAVNFPSTSLVVDDYLDIQGFPTASNNGLWRVESIATATDFTLFKVDGATIVPEASGIGNCIMRENPINSPQTIVVQDDTGADIAVDINAATITKGFAYTTNVQGGRTQAGSTNSGGNVGTGDNVYDAVVVARAIGLEEGQFVESAPTNIPKSTAPITISLVAAKERNYSDPV
jgi:hypothetical protein